MSTRSPRDDGGYLAGFFYAVRLRWALVISVALVVSLLVTTFVVFRGSEYTAESLVKVRDLSEGGTQEISRGRLLEVREAANTEEVSRAAMEGMGWRRGIEEFELSLEAEPTNEGELNVAFSAGDPALAAEAANAYARAFVERVDRLDQDRLAGGSLNAGAEVIREARSPSESFGGRPVAVGIVALAPGLAAGGALALMLAARDRRWRGVRDAEITLGAPVLGVIPEYGESEPETAEEGVVSDV